LNKMTYTHERRGSLGGARRGVLGGAWLFAVVACSSEGTTDDEVSTVDPSATVTPSAQSANTLATTSNGTSLGTTSVATSIATTANVTSSPLNALQVELMWNNLTYPTALRDGGDVIFTSDRGQILGKSSTLLALPKAGGPLKPLASVARADSIAVTDFLWVLNGPLRQITQFDASTGVRLSEYDVADHIAALYAAGGSLYAAGDAGIHWQSPETSEAKLVWSVGVDEEVWLMTSNDTSLFLTIDPPYPAEPGGTYRVVRVDVDHTSGVTTGAPVELARGIGSARGVALTSDSLIYADHENQEVYSVPLAGGDKTLLAEIPRPWSIGVNSQHLYIASRVDDCTGDGAIYRVPVGGGDVEQIASQQSCPSNVLVTEEEVYWLNAGPEAPTMVTGAFSSIMRVQL
jgi:hypothetical protein